MTSIFMVVCGAVVKVTASPVKRGASAPIATATIPTTKATRNVFIPLPKATGNVNHN